MTYLVLHVSEEHVSLSRWLVETEIVLMEKSGKGENRWHAHTNS